MHHVLKKKRGNKIRCDMRALNQFCLNQTIIRESIISVSWAHSAVALYNHSTSKGVEDERSDAVIVK